MSNPTAAADRRVVITGVGLVSPLGSSVEELKEALASGRSGVARRDGEAEPQIAGVANQFTGTIGDFGDLEGPQKKAIRKGLKLMCRETQMAVASAQLALANSNDAADAFDPERTGVVLGSDYMLTMPEDYADAIGKCSTDESGALGDFEYGRWGGDGLRDMQPLWMLKYLPNMPASHIAIYNDLRGPNNSLTMREASGLMAIGEATRIIQRGAADRMIAGATGTRVLPMQAIHAMQTEKIAGLNGETAAPETLSRPFDKDRTGMVCGEGAGMVVLESLATAESRGAHIYGEVVGFGSSVVTKNDLSGCNEVAVANAVGAALRDAGKRPADLGHVNAEGLGAPQADAEEARAIRAALGDAADTTPVVALKSYFGALGAGSGVVELIGSLIALESNQLPANLNHNTPDPDCPINAAHQSGAAAGESFLALNTTPQGQAAAVCVAQLS